MQKLINLYKFAFKMINYKRYMAVTYLLLTIATGLSALGFPYIGGLFVQNINEISSKMTTPYLIAQDKTIIIICSFALLYLFLNLLYELFSAKICVNIEREIYAKVFKKLFSSSKEQMKKMTIGEIQIKFSELDKICDYARYYVDALRDVLVAASCIAYIYLLSQYLLAVTCILLLTLFYSEVVKRKQKKYILKYRQAAGELSSKYVYNISKYNDISNLHANQRIIDDSISTYENFLKALYDRFLFLIMAGNLKKLLTYLIVGIIGVSSILLISMGHVSYSHIITYFLILNVFKSTIESITSVIEKRNEFELQQEYFADFMSIRPEETDQSKAITDIDKVVVNKVSFSYEGTKNIFNNFSLELSNSNVHVIKGGNGIGKSTLFNLINGSLRANDGAIVAGNGSKLTRNDVVTILPDDHYFYTGDILSDLKLMTGKSEEDIVKVLEDFQIDYISLNKNKKKNAEHLSTGQRKILSVIRGVLLRPKVLLLDEPLANLSPYYIDKILNAVKEIKGVVCMISHDITDRILSDPTFVVHEIKNNAK
ncbi:MAG: ABC transporter ATP-binding protein [Oligoflexia bacterium]|nr:ABC transporter ATP-binding protein [Oligoflexia bacterium]